MSNNERKYPSPENHTLGMDNLFWVFEGVIVTISLIVVFLFTL